MYLTAKYAALLLDNKGYTPKQAFQLLLQAFQDDQVIQDMEPILNWLHISLHATLATNRGPLSTNLTITAPFLDEDLLNHRDPLLMAILPGHHQLDGRLEATITQMASAVVTQTTEPDQRI